MPNNYQKWKKYVSELHSNLLEFSDSEYIYDFLSEVVKSNDELKKFPQDFFVFINRCYYHSALLLIRRLSDSNPESISLVTLLQSFLNSPNEFKLIDQKKYNFYGLSNSSICADIQKILDVCKLVNKVVNKKGVAHLDITHKKYLFNDAEFDIAMKTLKCIAGKYFDIFRYASFGKESYEILYNWHDVFKIPWIRLS